MRAVRRVARRDSAVAGRLPPRRCEHVSTDGWITLAVVLVTVALLVSDRLPHAMTLLGAVVVLVAARVVDVSEAFSGFSNTAPLTVAALYVLAAGVEKTRVLDRLAERLLGAGAEEPGRRTLARALAPTAAASSFLNNTAVVAMSSSTVVAWARRTGGSPSPLLIPLSFAAILGGVVTLVGTSTTLVVSGLLERAGERPLGLFEIGKVGLPVAVCGVALLVVLAPRLLPKRSAPSERVEVDAREFIVGATVVANGPLAGRTVTEAGLRNLEGVFLAEIERGDRRIVPVGPEETLHGGDHLTFAGNVRRILDLQERAGLASAEEPHVAAASAGARRLYEAVVADGSPLAGSTLKQVGFRGRYGGAVLAVHRSTERIPSKLGEVTLRPGDVLLVLSDAAFRERSLGRRDFLTVAALEGEAPGSTEKGWIVGALVAALFVLVGSGALPILPAALFVAFGLVVGGVLTVDEARRAIDLDVVITIAASFGLGAAMSRSGLARHLGNGIAGALGGFGSVGLLVGMLVATLVLTELITNNAAAVLMFPIALSTAAEAGLAVRGFAIAVALGASCSFLTPIGYQTNTMVYGIGGYRFGDFARVGLPLTVLTIAIGALVIPIAWPL